MTKSKKITYQEYDKIGEQFNDILDRIVHLEVLVLNSFGKTKARKNVDQIAKSRKNISEIRYKIENEILEIYPNAPLIDSFRKYRGMKDHNNASKMDEITKKWMEGNEHKKTEVKQ